jgi:streptogramin lyase
MSQQQSPTSHPSPHRWTSLGLWIGMVLLLTTTILGIYAIVTKQDIIFAVISFGLVIFAVPLGILQIAPSSLVQMRQTIKMGLLVIGISLLLGSLTLNLILLLRPQVHSSFDLNASPTSGPKPALTPTLKGTPPSVSPSAGHLSEFLIPTPNSRPVSIASGSDGNFWFTEERGNKIGRVTSQGVITEFLIPVSNSIPGGLTRGSDGNLWFFENRGDKIGRVTSQGKITEFPVPAGSDLVGITSGPDGNLWFAGYKPNKIWRMTTSGVITGEFAISTDGSGTETIIAGPDGNVWFVEDWGNKIGRITPQGSITEFPIPTPLVSGQQNYHDMIVGPDGNLWFTEGLANKIGRITPQGEITEFPVPPPGGNPGSLCAGPDGNLWFTDDAKHIRRLTTSGMFLGEFMIPTPGIRPAALTVGPDKNIWFIEPSGNKIGQITTGL